jgi:hypothetical protein
MTYGDVVIAVVSEPRGQHSHGYCEYVLSIINHSHDRSHVVTLRMPQDSFGYYTEFIRSLTRTVEVGPDSAARVSLLQPYYPAMTGSGVKVAVDGRTYDEIVPLAPAASLLGVGGRFFPAGGGSMAVAGTSPLIRVSKGVPVEFRVHAAETPAPDIHGAGMVPGMPGARTVLQSQLEQDPAPLQEWSANWLGYSRYDGIVVTAGELAAAPEGVRTAVWQYAEAGGTLLVLGKDVAVPPAWKGRRHESTGLTCYQTAFGRCVVAADDRFPSWPAERWTLLGELWHDTSDAWNMMASAADANRRFRIVDDVQIPVRGLFVLMLAFSILIGPVNLWFLARRNRRMWLLWTVPGISLLTCLLVFGYMVASEGWGGHLRTEGLTLLDETTHRATSIGWTGFYAPLTPGDGLHFSTGTEVLWQKGQDGMGYRYGRSSTTPCTSDWSRDQHLASGWVSARIPSHFKLRKSETGRRERLTVERAADGTLTAVNGLGADVIKLWVCDDSGSLYTAAGVAAGARVALVPQGRSLRGEQPQALRDLVRNDTWLVGTAPSPSTGTMTYGFKTPVAPATAAVMMPKPTSPGPFPKVAPPPATQKPTVPTTAPPPLEPRAAPVTDLTRFLGRRMYLAELDGDPFLEDGLAGARSRQCHCRVLGILRGPDDGN